MEYHEAIGRIVSELQSIEFMLRWWLCTEGGFDIVLPRFASEELVETPINDWRTLGELINAYNARLSSDESKKFSVDVTIVAIRDAIAHGRPLAVGDEEHRTLYRFSKPAAGKVRTEAMKLLSPEVLKRELDTARQQFEKILACGTGRGYFH